MSYAQQLSTVRSLKVPRNTNKRFACPFCGGSNTLSVGWDQGDLTWFCFRASCNVKGRSSESRSVSDIRDALLNRETSVKEFIPPAHFTVPLTSQANVDWLRRNHCMEAYQSRLAKLKYDPKENRLVFLVQHEGQTVDAVGRAMEAGVKPKWRRYGNSPYPFTCGTNKALAIVVEDAASACAVSSLATGVALMGTNLKDTYIGFLRNYDKCIVSLDPDARAKGIWMANVLSAYVETTVAFPSDDLKYFDRQEIIKQLKLSV